MSDQIGDTPEVLRKMYSDLVKVADIDEVQAKQGVQRGRIEISDEEFEEIIRRSNARRIGTTALEE